MRYLCGCFTGDKIRIEVDTLPLLILGGGIAAGLMLGLMFLMIRITMIRGQRSAEPRCPNCHGHDIRPSFQRGFLDAVYSFFSCMPYRCRACEARFYRYPSPKADASDAA
jgi:hypothetical protein